MIKKHLIHFKIFYLAELLAGGFIFIRPEITERAFSNSFHFTIEILEILPPVLILLGLLDIWLPTHLVESHLGKHSGVKGVLIALLLGTTAAGPLFTAFPIASTFSGKGGRTANIVIFLCSWATIKLPLLLMESRFLGLKFSLLRLLVTIPFILLVGVLVEMFSRVDPSQ